MFGINISSNFNDSTKPGDIIFEFNQKIINDYKILHINSWALQNNEHSKFIITKEIPNVIKYIKAIWIPKYSKTEEFSKLKKRWKGLIKYYD